MYLFWHCAPRRDFYEDANIIKKIFVDETSQILLYIIALRTFLPIRVCRDSAPFDQAIVNRDGSFSTDKQSLWCLYFVTALSRLLSTKGKNIKERAAEVEDTQQWDVPEFWHSFINSIASLFPWKFTPMGFCNFNASYCSHFVKKTPWLH